MDIEKIIELFKLYGYYFEEKTENCVVFSLKSGMYPAVQIVPLSETDEQEIEQIRTQYSNCGYGVYVCEKEHVNDLENYLFNGFFHVKTSNARIAARYQDYIYSVMKPYVFGDEDINVLKQKYKYINVDYSLELDFIQSDTNDCIVNSIYGQLQKKGAQLIIIEAAAGYGKTSTAFELLNKYVNVKDGIRPFFMELSKERTASNFRYAMLSQIDQTFDQNIKNEIVIYNIKKGRIPLIVDGFDELLSKDLDNGSSSSSVFRSVETMLSTIADLLTEDTKIVLTTRKTAIFSGESFMEWYENQQRHGCLFSVARYELNAPEPSEWLDEKRMSLIPFEVNSVRNPVLLSYLKYVDEKELEKIKNPSQIIDRFFSFMMKREQRRQEIPFNIDEQFSIFRKLAICFAGFDITADKRSEVKSTIFETSNSLLKAYSTIEKDEDSLANALTNHALLDRKKNGNVGFLNDFIYGYLLGNALLEENAEDNRDYFDEYSYSSLIKMIESMSVADKEERYQFYDKFVSSFKLEYDLQFWADIKLKRKALHQYHDLAFNNSFIDSVSFEGDTFSFSKCVFSNMTFKNSTFDFHKFLNCSFVNCHFERCVYDGASGSFLFNCSGIDIEEYEECQCEKEQMETDKNIDNRILDCFLQVDKKTRRMRKISTLRTIFSEVKNFKKIFESLVRHGYVLTNGDKAFITDEGINKLGAL